MADLVMADLVCKESPWVGLDILVNWWVGMYSFS
jgi:hypothetical protein